MTESGNNQTQLKQSISLLQATIYGVGIILGAGIYALIGEAAGLAGNAVWVSFLFAALIAGCSAISYAELSARYPRSAAEFIYVKEITGSAFWGFMTGYITILTGVISVAAVALGFATYFKSYMNFNPILIAVAVIFLTSLLNYRGIQQSARVNTVFTLIEAGGLIFIIFIGLPYLGEVDLLTAGPSLSIQDGQAWKFIFAASALIFFAYIGFEDVANIAEETKNPVKTVPLALLLSLLITTIIYALVAMVSVSVVPTELLVASSKLDSPGEGPLALVASTALNSSAGGTLFTVIALCATANTVLILNIVTSRMFYGIAREKCLPQLLAKVNPKTQTPSNAIIIATVLCVLFTLNGSLGDVASLTNVGVFITFFIVNMMLLIHRYKTRNNRQETDKTLLPMAVNIGWFPLLPALGALFCLGMFLTQFWQPITIFGQDMPIIILAIIIAATAIPIYKVSAKT